MLNTILEFKNSILLKVFFSLAMTLIVIGMIAFCGYDVYENYIKSK